MTVLGVVGAGTMGAGIAQLGAAAGMRTLLHDPMPEALERVEEGDAASRQAFAAYREKAAEPLDPEEWRRVDLRLFRPENFSIRPQADTAVGIETLMR